MPIIYPHAENKRWADTRQLPVNPNIMESLALRAACMASSSTPENEEINPKIAQALKKALSPAVLNAVTDRKGFVTRKRIESALSANFASFTGLSAGFRWRTRLKTRLSRSDGMRWGKAL